ncbi:MAG: T9SS type A sorting domain-containing protein, partial [Bacteroidota bacterium]
VHTYQNPGNYTVTLRASNCFSLDTIANVITVGTSGISELNSLPWVFPNPTYDKLQITDSKITGVDVVSLEGKSLLKINEPVSELDLSALPDGFYMLKIYKNSETVFLKILKTSRD